MTDGPDDLRVVSFAAGGFRFATEAGQIRGLLDGDAPGDAVEMLIGLPPANGTRRKRLAIGNHKKYIAVDEPVELETWPAVNIHALPPAVAARIALRGVRGLAVVPAGIVLIIDLDALLASNGWDRPL